MGGGEGRVWSGGDGVDGVKGCGRKGEGGGWRDWDGFLLGFCGGVLCFDFWYYLVTSSVGGAYSTLAMIILPLLYEIVKMSRLLFTEIFTRSPEKLVFKVRGRLHARDLSVCSTEPEN